MAETELEALNDIIDQNDLIIDALEDINIELGSGETSHLTTIISNQEILHGLFLHDVEEVEINRLDEIILNTNPIYTETEVIEQNTFVWENLQEIKEMQFSNYVLVGVVIALGLFIAVKGLFRNVT